MSVVSDVCHVRVELTVLSLNCRFLWKYDAASDEVKVFKPTGKNTYFAICDTDYIGFGGG